MNEITINASSRTQSLKSIGLIVYGLLAYNIGVAGLGLLILAMAGVLPLGQFLLPASSTLSAVSINLALLLLFGLQHSIMARPTFKKRFEKVLPQALERSTFVLASGLVLAITVLLWQPIEGWVWQTQGLLNYCLWGAFVFAWGYLLLATFAINHWDLFGLRQVWIAARGNNYSALEFKERWMYRYSRHPIMLGALLGVWCVPAMTVSMLMLSVGLSVYIAVGLYFEERDLVSQWGQAYLDYKKRVNALF